MYSAAHISIAAHRDIELWTAALHQLRSDHNGLDLALVNETLRASEFADRLSQITRERALVD